MYVFRFLTFEPFSQPFSKFYSTLIFGRKTQSQVASKIINNPVLSRAKSMFKDYISIDFVA